MINKYFRLAKETKDLEYEIKSKIRCLAKEEGQTLAINFYMGNFRIVGMHFSTYFSDEGKQITSPLCESNDMPETLESAAKAEEMFKAKNEWEELLVKIDEVLAE